MLAIDTTRAAKLRALNDLFRVTFSGGRIVLTRAVSALPGDMRLKVMQIVRDFKDFTDDNDPFQEHDCACFTVDGERYIWKIEYYDPSVTVHSEDSTDPRKTIRVLTIMKAEEY